MKTIKRFLRSLVIDWPSGKGKYTPDHTFVVIRSLAGMAFVAFIPLAYAMHLNKNGVASLFAPAVAVSLFFASIMSNDVMPGTIGDGVVWQRTKRSLRRALFVRPTSAWHIFLAPFWTINRLFVFPFRFILFPISKLVWGGVRFVSVPVLRRMGILAQEANAFLRKDISSKTAHEIIVEGEDRQAAHAEDLLDAFSSRLRQTLEARQQHTGIRVNPFRAPALPPEDAKLLEELERVIDLVKNRGRS